TRPEVRTLLGLSEQEKVILVTMGGIAGTELPVRQLKACKDFCFILAGQTGQRGKGVANQDNILFLPANSTIRHPDLIAACDAVIGKIGYSTLAEVYQAGIPFAYIGREWFRESQPLADFIAQEMPSLPLTEEAFQQQNLSDILTKLCQLPRHDQSHENGAAMVADFLEKLLLGKMAK
ncbi:MAG: hypothetical protein D3919_05455, partial [Candidatus Electrothrix sp. AW5]|nr:hypothetical protein [Candidatus Electrothrix gigas]